MQSIILGRCAALAIVVLLPLTLRAQTIYRCANSYSQTPCPGAVAIAVDDGRTPAQKAQTDAATVQARQQANQMERDRLALERSAMTAPPTPKAAQRNKTAKPAAASKARKSADPAYFTAAPWHDANKQKSGSGN